MTNAVDEFIAKVDQELTERTVIVEPGSSRVVGLGVYDDSVADPRVEISFVPDLREQVGVSRERIDLPGDSRYVLLYQIHNFSHEPCSITLRMAD
jgi:hypothetical protein